MGKDAVAIRQEFHSRLGEIARQLARELYPEGLPRGTKFSELEAVAGALADEMARQLIEINVQEQADTWRPAIESKRRVPAELKYATVHKQRQKGRVVAITTAVVLGTWAAVALALERSSASRTINTSFLERHHLTDRHHNARKSRKTSRFSKDWRMHEAMTYFTKYSDNFCWPVRTLREKTEPRHWKKRTPAMAAGLADHVWSLKEWLTFPAVQQLQDTTNLLFSQDSDILFRRPEGSLLKH